MSARVNAQPCGSKKDSVGADLLTFVRASSWCGVLIKFFFALSKGHRGVGNNAMELLHEDSWFANPKKECRLEQLAGVRNL